MRVAFVVFCLLLMPTPASAQDGSVLELVEECDVLAAHPDDPERMAEGVADDRIVPRLAILACERALKEKPSEPRYQFQIGRAYLALNKKKEAFDWFTKASNADYAAAWAYVGDAYQFGHGVTPNPGKALETYQKAAAKGFEPAAAQIKQLQFDPNLYTGEFLAAFFNADFSQIASKSNDSQLRPLVRNYIFSLIQALIKECNQFVTPTAVPLLYQYRYPQGWSAQSDDNVAVAIQTSVGEFDATTFVGRHGCEGPVAKHVFANINAFLKSHR